ncbi:Molybdenum cofactor sulfurase [Dionaea muscipula]
MKRGCRLPPLQVSAIRFHPNLVISGGKPNAEDGWTRVTIGSNNFIVGEVHRTKAPPCCIANFGKRGFLDNVTWRMQPMPDDKFWASRRAGSEVKRTIGHLGIYRRSKGRILFGILLRHENNNVPIQDSWLHVGQEVHADIMR